MTHSGSLFDNLNHFLSYSALSHFTIGQFAMICIGLVLIFLAITKHFAPMLLVPIGFGIVLGNIPFIPGMQLGINEAGSVLGVLNMGILNGLFASLIFLGIGAMTDFSALISNPKLLIIGVASQVGVICAYLLATYFGFTPSEAGSIGIIGCAGAPTALFASAKLAPHLIAIVSVSAYLYLAFAPVIQPMVMKLVTTSSERVIKMKSPRAVSKLEKILFPLVGLLFTAFIVPEALPLLGMLFFGNLLKESTVTAKLSDTAKGPVIDVVMILIGLTLGASLSALDVFTMKSLQIFVLGLLSFVVATIFGVLIIKVFNVFLKQENKINPLIGNSGLASMPESARVSQKVGLEYDETNHLLMHAMGPNVAGVIGSAIAAGIMLSFLM